MLSPTERMTTGLRFNLAGLAQVCVGLLWLSILSELAFAGQNVLTLNFLAGAEGGALTGAELEQAALRVDQVATVVGIAYLVVYLATTVLCSVWIYRASWNAREIQPDPNRITPGWAIGWFFVPLLSLWKPYGAMVQCLNSSVNPQGGIDTPAPGFVTGWWIFWVVTTLGGNVSFRLSNRAGTYDDFRVAAIFDLGLAPISIVSAILFIRVIKTITQAQQGRHPAQAIEETFA